MRLLKRPATSPSDQKWLSAAQKRDFLIYLGTVILSGFAVQIQTITISWHVYQLTHNPIDLALVGLPRAHVFAYRGSHGLHTAMAAALAAQAPRLPVPVPTH